MCECELHKECTRKIHSSERGTLFIETKDHFSCGKIQAQIRDLARIVNQVGSKNYPAKISNIKK